MKPYADPRENKDSDFFAGLSFSIESIESKLLIDRASKLSGFPVLEVEAEAAEAASFCFLLSTLATMMRAMRTQAAMMTATMIPTVVRLGVGVGAGRWFGGD
jgi:hypothetical protein